MTRKAEPKVLCPAPAHNTAFYGFFTTILGLAGAQFALSSPTAAAPAALAHPINFAMPSSGAVPSWIDSQPHIIARNIVKTAAHPKPAAPPAPVQAQASVAPQVVRTAASQPVTPAAPAATVQASASVATARTPWADSVQNALKARKAEHPLSAEHAVVAAARTAPAAAPRSTAWADSVKAALAHKENEPVQTAATPAKAAPVTPPVKVVQAPAPVHRIELAAASTASPAQGATAASASAKAAGAAQTSWADSVRYALAHRNDSVVQPDSAEPERLASRAMHWIQRGVASWYGNEFHNRLAADGSRFNQNKMTAAHLHLPFGTKLRVKSLDTGKSVVVTVTDRGPYRHHRILDLSRAAAAKLGILHQGVGRVVIARIEPGKNSSDAVEVAEAPGE